MVNENAPDTVSVAEVALNASSSATSVASNAPENVRAEPV